MSIAEIVLVSAMILIAKALFVTACVVYAVVILVWYVRLIRKVIHG